MHVYTGDLACEQVLQSQEFSSAGVTGSSFAQGCTSVALPGKDEREVLLSRVAWIQQPGSLFITGVHLPWLWRQSDTKDGQRKANGTARSSLGHPQGTASSELCKLTLARALMNRCCNYIVTDRAGPVSHPKHCLRHASTAKGNSKRACTHTRKYNQINCGSLHVPRVAWNAAGCQNQKAIKIVTCWIPRRHLAEKYHTSGFWLAQVCPQYPATCIHAAC